MVNVLSDQPPVPEIRQKGLGLCTRAGLPFESFPRPDTARARHACGQCFSLHTFWDIHIKGKKQPTDSGPKRRALESLGGPSELLYGGRCRCIYGPRSLSSITQSPPLTCLSEASSGFDLTLAETTLHSIQRDRNSSYGKV